MKKIQWLLLAWVCLFCLGCQSFFAPKIGMTRDQWLHRTLFAKPVVAHDDREVWRYGGSYYYFHEGILDYIDQGQRLKKHSKFDTLAKDR